MFFASKAHLTLIVFVYKLSEVPPYSWGHHFAWERQMLAPQSLSPPVLYPNRCSLCSLEDFQSGLLFFVELHKGKQRLGSGRKGRAWGWDQEWFGGVGRCSVLWISSPHYFSQVGESRQRLEPVFLPRRLPCAEAAHAQFLHNVCSILNFSLQTASMC